MWYPAEVFKQFIEDYDFMGKLSRLLATDINAGKHIAQPVNDFIFAQHSHIERLILMLRHLDL